MLKNDLYLLFVHDSLSVQIQAVRYRVAAPSSW